MSGRLIVAVTALVALAAGGAIALAALLLLAVISLGARPLRAAQ